MPCLFERDFSDKRKPVLLRTVTSGCEWVLAGEGIPTRKYDGTACLVQNGKLYKRYDAKRGKTPPEGFVPCGEPDEITGHHPGWILVDSGPENRWHNEAWTGLRASDGSRFRPAAMVGPGALEDGTYELCGPRLQGNPEMLTEHVFIKHGSVMVNGFLYSWEGLHDFFSTTMMEGIVWHRKNGNGDMVKLRRGDYGFPWPPPSTLNLNVEQKVDVARRSVLIVVKPRDDKFEVIKSSTHTVGQLISSEELDDLIRLHPRKILILEAPQKP
jgi:hypothetical protein